jgi:FkbM family methyltransferase
MLQGVKQSIRSIIPFLQRTRTAQEDPREQQRRFFAQKTAILRCGNFDLLSPESHLLFELQKIGPYRDLCIGISAKIICEKYHNATIVDIGANIGDTAAIIASHVPNKLILVEGSDYYYKFLEKNLHLFPNAIVPIKAIVSDGISIQGELRHWGGTAYFKGIANEELTTPTLPLSEIADENTRFIKIDTDGFECNILNAALPWLEQQRPAILFENQLRNEMELKRLSKLYDSLSNIGYRYFVAWDDPGFHILSTDSVDAIKDLNRYQYNIHNSNLPRINNYDIICLHESDEDIYTQLTRFWRRDCVLPPQNVQPLRRAA